MGGLALHLLGSPLIRLDDGPAHFDTRKATALLAYLACTGHAHTREALAALFWPEYADARNALRRTLSTLQHALGPGWLDAGRDRLALANRPDLWLDVAVFERMTDPAADRNALTEGLALYRGDFLAGFTLRDSMAFDEWQLFEAERLRQRCASGLERLTLLHAEAGDTRAAIDTARRRIALDPLHEPAHQVLMRLYLATGQRTAALRQYRVCAQRLEEEFGATPSDETVRLYEAIQAATSPSALPTFVTPSTLYGEAPTRSLPDAPLAGPPLVGREGEQAQLRTLFGNATSGGFAAITGQPGIGKTRLAEDLLALARQAGAGTLVARCYDGESTLAYAPVAALVRSALGTLERAERLAALPVSRLTEVTRLVPDLARHGDATALQPLTGPEARRRFFEAVADLLFAATAGHAPGVLFVDDAHWADGASLDVLAFLARRLYGHPVLLILTWREEEVPSGHPLRALLGEARRTGPAELVQLEPLSAAAVATLAHTDDASLSPALLARLYDESAGLPLLVVEYLAALREGGLAPEERLWPLPGRARDLLEARLRPLSEAARALLAAASTIGHAFDLPTLCTAVGVTEDAAVDALEELLARGLITEATATPLRYSFSHERLRTMVYERISRARRQLLHRRVAAHLAALLAGGPRPGLSAQVAYHASSAGEHALAAAHHRIAGDEARALAANAEAASHYAAALEGGHPEAAILHEDLGDLLALGGNYADALRHYGTAQAHGATNYAVARKTGELHHRLGAWDAAEAQFAVALAAPEACSAERARASAAWSLTARRRGDLAAAARLAREALALAEASRDPRALARAHGAAGALAAHEGDQARARNHLERGLALAEQVDDPETQVSALNSLALALAETDPARAIALAEAALGLCLARDDRHRAAALHNTLADLRHAQGDREASMAHLRKAVALFAAIGHDQPEIWMLTEW